MLPVVNLREDEVMRTFHIHPSQRLGAWILLCSCKVNSLFQQENRYRWCILSRHGHRIKLNNSEMDLYSHLYLSKNITCTSLALESSEPLFNLLFTLLQAIFFTLFLPIHVFNVFQRLLSGLATAHSPALPNWMGTSAPALYSEVSWKRTKKIPMGHRNDRIDGYALADSRFTSIVGLFSFHFVAH